MKILIVQDTDWIRRNPYQHTHLAERLRLRGHDIRVIDYEILWREEGRRELLSRRQVRDVARLFPGAEIPVIRPPIVKVPVLDYVSMLFTYRHEIRRQMKEFRPDLVFGCDILTTYLAYGEARRRGIKTLHYCIDIDYRLVPYRFLQPLGKLVESRNIRSADVVLSINEGLRQYTVRMGADPARTRVLPAGIDPEQYHTGVDGSGIRQEYGIAEDDVVLFFTGWLYDFSGLKEAAVELSKARDDHVKLLVVGDGDAYDDIDRTRREYGVEDRVILTGRQPYETMPRFIAASDVCLLPAYNNEIMRDIVPIKMYEYMAMEKPVVATRLPGLVKEFGEDSGVVYVDRPEDAVARAVELVRTGSAGGVGRQARRFAERNSWDNVTDGFERILEEMVRND